MKIAIAIILAVALQMALCDDRAESRHDHKKGENPEDHKDHDHKKEASETEVAKEATSDKKEVTEEKEDLEGAELWHRRHHYPYYRYGFPMHYNYYPYYNRFAWPLYY